MARRVRRPAGLTHRTDGLPDWRRRRDAEPGSTGQRPQSSQVAASLGSGLSSGGRCEIRVRLTQDDLAERPRRPGRRTAVISERGWVPEQTMRALIFLLFTLVALAVAYYYYGRPIHTMTRVIAEAGVAA